MEENKSTSEKERLVLYNSFMNVPTGIAILKGDTHMYEFANSAYEKLVGKKIDIGKTVKELFPEVEAQGIIKMLDSVLATGEPFFAKELAVELNTKADGILEKFFVDFVIQPLKTEDGQVDRLLVNVVNVTEHVNAIKLTEASEKRFSNILSQSLMAIAILQGPEMIVTFANEPIIDIWGKGSDVFGKSLMEVLPEIKEQVFPTLLQEVYTTGVHFANNEILCVLNRKGKMEDCYFNLVYQPYKDADNTITGITILATEVTEQVLANKQLLKSDEEQKKLASHLKLATESADIGTWSLDLQTEKLQWSGLHKKMWGYDEQQTDLEYNDWHKLIINEDKEKAFKKIEEARINRTLYEVEYRINTANTGALRYMRSVGKYYYNQQGEAETLTGISLDITEKKKLEDGIRESEEKIRNFILQAPVAMCLYRGAQYIIEIVNDELLSIWDKPLSAVINKPVFEALPEVAGQGFEAMLGKVYTTGEKFSAFGIPVVLSRNGKPKTIYVNLVYQAYREADGAISGIVEVVSDVTEQVTATQQLEASENQFRTFADSIQNLAWIANGEGWINWYNQRWYDYTGTTLEEMTGWGWDKVHHPDHIAKVVAFVKNAWTKDKAWELTFPLRRFDGVYHWFLTRAYPVKDANGNIERWIGTNTDITEQKSFTEELETKVKERTEELQIKNQTFELAENIAKFGSYKWIISSGTLEYSDNLFRLLDCEPNEFEPSFEKFLTFIHRDDLQQVIKNGEQTMQIGRLVETPYRIVSKTGAIKYLRSSGSFIGEGNNRILIGTVQDITNDITAAEALRTKNIELELSNTELASFSYAASHDLKEPLRKIQVFSKLIIEKENFTDKTQDYFNRIILAAERMQNLIDSLLDFSSANSAELFFTPCDLNSIVEDSKSDLNLSILEKEATIEYENLPVINGVLIQLSQLFTNLIDNAIKYSRPHIKPYIKITASRINGSEIGDPAANEQKEYYCIQISDNGIGFKKEHDLKIFKLFQRLHHKNEYSGTGVGLAIVKRIVSNHNGFIIAEGEPDEGAVFSVYFPIA